VARTVTEDRKMLVRVSEHLHRTVRVRAAELGRPISEIVRGLLRKWVEGEVETPSKEEGRLEQG
jgi:plasmid stability protein